MAAEAVGEGPDGQEDEGEVPASRAPLAARRHCARPCLAGVRARRSARAPARQLHDQPLRRPAGGSGRIDLDVVIDQAELPTFTERQRIDTDGDGSVSDEELDAERLVACGRLAGSLHLTVDGKAVALTAFAAGMSMPPGAAGLSTMRTVCEYSAPSRLGAAARPSPSRTGRSPSGSVGARSASRATARRCPMACRSRPTASARRQTSRWTSGADD